MVDYFVQYSKMTSIHFHCISKQLIAVLWLNPVSLEALEDGGGVSYAILKIQIHQLSHKLADLRGTARKWLYLVIARKTREMSREVLVALSERTAESRFT